MSGEATGYVYRYSPYTDKTFNVHLAIADSVNDQHENDFWMSPKRLAAKARCSRATVFTALAQLVDDGFLVLLEAGDSRRHLPARYRFKFAEILVVFDSHPDEPVEVDHGGRPRNPVHSLDEVPNPVQELDRVIPPKPSPTDEAFVPKPSPNGGPHKDELKKILELTQEKQLAKRGSSSSLPHVIPDDWEPPPGELLRMAVDCPAVNIDRETAQIVDWAKSNRIKKVDWDATWRKCLRNAQTDAEGGVGRRGQATSNGHSNGTVRHIPFGGFSEAEYDEKEIR